jgi:hypothetical protein
MRKFRRRFGDWQLYTGRPVTLGCRPPSSAKNDLYHVTVSDCQTEEGYKDWLRQLTEKAGFDVSGFKLAIETLRAEGKYLKPLKESKGGQSNGKS